MKFEIKNRWSGNVQYSCELSAEVAGKSYGFQLGFAIKSAVDSGADLRDAVLRDADLRGADLRGAVLRDADLSGADLRGAACPITIPNIHQAVLEAASKPEALDMGSWHNACGTAHCRAGWVVTLAGDGGRALEWVLGTPAAAALIYQASDPTMERVPDFYASNDAALEDMRRLADAERAAAA